MIMKMINSTSRMSIIGITFGSCDSPPCSFPTENAIERSSRRGLGCDPGSSGSRGSVLFHRGLRAWTLVADRADDAHAILRRNIDRVEHGLIRQLTVSLHEQDLVH